MKKGITFAELLVIIVIIFIIASILWPNHDKTTNSISCEQDYEDHRRTHNWRPSLECAMFLREKYGIHTVIGDK